MARASRLRGRASLAYEHSGFIADGDSSYPPADAERDRHRRVGLGFNAAPQPFFKRDGGVPRHIRGLPVQVLGGPGRLVQLTLDLLFDIAGDAADPSSNLPPRLRAVPAIRSSFIGSSQGILRGLAPLSSSALQRKPDLNVPHGGGFYPGVLRQTLCDP